MKYLYLILAALVALSVSGCGEDDDDSGSAGYDTTGTWIGTMVAGDANISGSIQVDVIQDGDAMTGTASATNVPCFSSVLFRGTLNQETQQFVGELYSETDPAALVTMNGFFFPDSDSMEASYFVDNWGVCTGGFGELQATRR